MKNNNNRPELIRIASELSHEVAKLTAQHISITEKMGKYAKKTRKLIYWLLVSLVLDITLTIVLVLVGHGVQSNTEDIGRITDRLNTQVTVQRQKALCPLYTIFLQSKSKQARDASPDPKKYDAAFKVIQEGFDALRCSEFIEH